MRRLGPGDLDEAVALLRGGAVVAIPTDTVYGLAARIGDDVALDALYVAKGRPETKPLPVLVADPAELGELLGELPSELEALVSRHWPGALTIVADCGQEVARRVRSSDSTVGVRCPDDPIARALLRATGPLCVTSANRSGEEPCRSADEVADAFLGSTSVAAVLDGGPRDGEPSTVVSLRSGALRVLRQGPIEP